ncbi:hypothetical protein SADUNF_Sadunf04G0101500 [Salix dunnii]|uniref:Uncharacterized protein n=1 Tax=Salix dunnii TaxID=1413687 RepID=A0A835K7T8_9ROSI|nr:hypothetical protein SADUNF_Sadunf04G0101500 [Salix dunnii]
MIFGCDRRFTCRKSLRTLTTDMKNQHGMICRLAWTRDICSFNACQWIRSDSSSISTRRRPSQFTSGIVSREEEVRGEGGGTIRHSLESYKTFIAERATGCILLMGQLDDNVPNNSPSSHDHSPVSLRSSSIDIVQHEPHTPQEIDSIHDTDSSSHISILQSNSSLHSDQVQPIRHLMVIRVQHGIHKPNPLYALILECGDIPDEPRNIKVALQHDVSLVPYNLTLKRPDLSFCVNYVSQLLHFSSLASMKMVRRILHYVKGSIHFSLYLTGDSTLDLCGFYDANWVGCPTTHRSTAGFCIFLG